MLTRTGQPMAANQSRIDTTRVDAPGVLALDRRIMASEIRPGHVPLCAATCQVSGRVSVMHRRRHFAGAFAVAATCGACLERGLLRRSQRAACSSGAAVLIPKFMRRGGCGTPGYATCHAIQRVTLNSGLRANAKPAAAAPGGLNPVDLQSAYGLSATGGSGQTVAIVDAYNDHDRRSRPRRVSCAVRTSRMYHANGCFRKTNRAARRIPPTTPAGPRRSRLTSTW